MNSLKFWQSILAVLWVFAFLGGGYYFYNAFFSDANNPVHIQGRGSDFSKYDITSPLGGVLFEKEKLNLFK